MKEETTITKTFGIFRYHNGKLQRVDTWYDVSGESTEHSVKEHFIEHGWIGDFVVREDGVERPTPTARMRFTFW